MKRLMSAAAVGVGMALLPLIALAESPAGATAQGRVVAAPADFGMVLFVTAFAVAGLFAVTSLGYLYRRERHLDWAFQAPAVPHDDAHH